MKQRSPRDPTVLEPAQVALHQVVSFAPDFDGRVDTLTRSSLFRVQRVHDGVVAEWVRYSLERDPSAFPLGRISVHPRALLLETFSEARMNLLESVASESGIGRVRADQLRVFRVADAVANPRNLVQPLHEPADEDLTAREVAVAYLRMAWPFLVREDLGGRNPESVLRTGRGRAALEAIVEELPRELRAEMPSFPAFSVDELFELLLAEQPAPIETSVRRPRSAAPRRKD